MKGQPLTLFPTLRRVISPRIDGRRHDWETPDWLFDRLNAEFTFTIDAAAHSENHKLSRYWSPREDGLAQDWSQERVWCNPPYGAGIGEWVAHARASGALCVLLVPVRSETHWWCEDVLAASEVRFIRGRVHFKIDGGPNRHPKGSRPVFSSAVVVFGNGSGLRVSSLTTPVIEDMEKRGRRLV